MGIINDISSLAPQMAIKCNQFRSKCKDVDLPVAINESLRPEIVQVLYYLQDKLDFANNPNILMEFNAIRKNHGFWPISMAETKKAVTWTLSSKHMKGMAFDAVPLDANGKPWWGNAPADVWEKMGVCGEEVGLAWGGRWKKKDCPHFEWKD
jgi:hypothetical protein